MFCRRPTFDITAIVHAIPIDRKVRVWYSADEWIGMISERSDIIPFGDFGKACFDVPMDFKIEHESFYNLIYPIPIAFVCIYFARSFARTPIIYHVCAAFLAICFSVCIIPLVLGGRTDIPTLSTISSIHVFVSWCISKSEKWVFDWGIYISAYLCFSAISGFSLARGYVTEVDVTLSKITETAIVLFAAVGASWNVPSDLMKIPIFFIAMTTTRLWKNKENSHEVIEKLIEKILDERKRKRRLR